MVEVIVEGVARLVMTVVVPDCVMEVELVTIVEV